VDWDPEGERNPQNRGKSPYVRISWDEALDIVVSEIKRVKETYGPYAILSQSDGHAETSTVHPAHGAQRKLLELLGGYTLQCRNTDSWEGWWWGAKHVWGMENLGQQMPVTNLMSDIARNTDMLLFWGCDPETTPWGFTGQLSSLLSYWFTELGIKSIYICPDLNYGAVIHADKWIPIRPNTDAALQLAIAYVWITPMTGNTWRPMPSALTRWRNMSWAERTACPKHPCGRPRSPACPRGSSKPWPGNGHPRRSPSLTETAAP